MPSPILNIVSDCYQQCGLSFIEIESDIASYLQEYSKLEFTKYERDKDYVEDGLASPMTSLMSQRLQEWIKDNINRKKHGNVDEAIKAICQEIDGYPQAKERLQLTAMILPLLAPVLDYSSLKKFRVQTEVTQKYHNNLKDDIEYFLDYCCGGQAKTDFIYNDSRENKLEIYFKKIALFMIVDFMTIEPYEKENWLERFFEREFENFCYSYRDESFSRLLPFVKARISFDYWDLISRSYSKLNRRFIEAYLFYQDDFKEQLGERDELFDNFVNKELSDADANENGLTSALSSLPTNRIYAFASAIYEKRKMIVIPNPCILVENIELVQWYIDKSDEITDGRNQEKIALLRCLLAKSKGRWHEAVEHLINDSGGFRHQIGYQGNNWDLLFKLTEASEDILPLCKSNNDDVRKAAHKRLLDVCDKDEIPEYYPIIIENPELILHGYRFNDPEVYRLAWENADKHQQVEVIREFVINCLFDRDSYDYPSLRRKKKNVAFEVGMELYIQEPEFCLNILQNNKFREGLGEFLSTQKDTQLQLVALKTLAQTQSHYIKSYTDQIRSLLDRNAAQIGTLSFDTKAMQNLMAVADSSHVALLSPLVQILLKKSKSKEFIQAVRDWLARAPMKDIEANSWLNPRAAFTKTITVPVLVDRINEDDAVSFLQALAVKIKNQALLDTIHDALESVGIESGGADELDLEEMEREAIKQIPKKLPKAVLDYRNKIQDLDSLSSELTTWILLLAYEGDGLTMPRSARQLLEYVSAEKRAAFVDGLFNIWINEFQGDSKNDWIRVFLRYYGDDRLVPLFLSGIKSWNKRSKPKANKMLSCLADIGSTLSLSQVKTIYEGKYSYAILSHAGELLKSVAEEMKLSLAELFEELTPTLGYERDGIHLDVGPYYYTAKLQADGKLLFIRSDNGKKFKSFPKCKAQEDAELHDQSNTKVKIFKKNIKAIAAQQTANFKMAYTLGKVWTPQRWKQLYWDHPLLLSLGQGLIWEGMGDSSSVTFRISDDGALIDVNDESIDLSDFQGVRLWHPVDGDQEAAAQWPEHLQDYEITPAFDQFDFGGEFDIEVQRCQNNPKAWLLKSHQGHVLPQSSFSSVLKKYGFQKGAIQDGPRIYDHYLSLPAEGINISIEHTPIDPWFSEDDMAIDHAKFSLGEAIGEVPKRLVAWVQSMLEECSSKGGGFDSNWSRLH